MYGSGQVVYRLVSIGRLIGRGRGEEGQRSRRVDVDVVVRGGVADHSRGAIVVRAPGVQIGEVLFQTVVRVETRRRDEGGLGPSKG